MTFHASSGASKDGATMSTGEHRPMKPLTTVWVNDGRADTLGWCEACDSQWPCAVARAVSDDGR